MSRNWEGIVVHHSASPGKVWGSEGCRNISVGDIRRWHVDQNFGDIGYHYVIDSDGFICKGRETDQIGAHCRADRKNHTSIGICVVGNFQYESPSEIQMSSLVMLVRYLKEEYGIPDKMIELHGNVAGAQTLCPGKFFPKDYFYKEIKEEF